MLFVSTFVAYKLGTCSKIARPEGSIVLVYVKAFKCENAICEWVNCTVH